jgi:hypothetical protein
VCCNCISGGGVLWSGEYGGWYLQRYNGAKLSCRVQNVRQSPGKRRYCDIPVGTGNCHACCVIDNLQLGPPCGPNMFLHPGASHKRRLYSRGDYWSLTNLNLCSSKTAGQKKILTRVDVSRFQYNIESNIIYGLYTQGQFYVKAKAKDVPLHAMKGLVGREGMSGYVLDDWAIEVRSQAEARDFSSSLCVQTGSVPTQPPVQRVPGVFSPRIKRGRGVTLTTNPHLVSRSWMSRSYTSSSPCATISVLWACFVFITDIYTTDTI